MCVCVCVRVYVMVRMEKGVGEAAKDKHGE